MPVCLVNNIQISVLTIRE